MNLKIHKENDNKTNSYESSNNILNRKNDTVHNNLLINIGLLIFVILYIFSCFLQYKSGNSIAGIISQFQVISSIFIAIELKTKGYIVSISLAIFHIVEVIILILFFKRFQAIPGILISLLTIVIINLLNKNLAKLNEKIGEALSQREKLKDLAYFDPLTGIPNRSTILKELNTLIMLSANKGIKFALVFIDLDEFKKINDSLGHNVGDNFLLAVISRINTIIDCEDIIGRIGGDEFALIIKRSLSDEEILKYLQSIQSALNQPFYLENFTLNTSASFGVSIFPRDGSSSDELLKNADMAMYKIKSMGKNDINFFNFEMKNNILKKIDLENNLRKAIGTDEMFIVFQPQYSTKEKKLRGFEALIRWNSPQLGIVRPDSMIPIAEETGLIVILGEWILRNSILMFKRIMNNSNIDAILSVNISTIQFMKTNFIDMIKNVLKETDFDPRHLELEVTESVFITSSEYAANVFRIIKDMGIHIALDDFGTGYSSLNYLQKLPIDILKLDKSFIDDILKSNSENQIVGDIISLMHKMDILVIAEGVETDKQLIYLNNYDCDYIQGFLWGKPLNEEELKSTISWFMQ
ncbi:MAG: EAL domain-containing protein [Bacillota bacterium]|nr:EAL domain-containing protein [Bacillota bacterium]